MTDTTPAIINGKRNIWVRGLLMLLMAVAYHISGVLLALGAIVQFALAVLGDGPNARLLAFGRSLGGIWARSQTSLALPRRTCRSRSAIGRRVADPMLSPLM